MSRTNVMQQLTRGGPGNYCDIVGDAFRGWRALYSEYTGAGTQVPASNKPPVFRVFFLKHYFQVSFNLKVILSMVEITPNTVT